MKTASKKLTEKAKELLRSIAELPEPFTSRDVVRVAKVGSSAPRLLLRFAAAGYLRVEKKGKQNQSFLYMRSDSFPRQSDISPKQAPAQVVEALERTPLEIAYWEMRDSFDIKSRNDDELYE